MNVPREECVVRSILDVSMIPYKKLTNNRDSMHTSLVECTKGRMQSIVDVSMIAYKKLTNNKDSMHYYLPPEREKSDHCYHAN